jgi:hypothetical protein
MLRFLRLTLLGLLLLAITLLSWRSLGRGSRTRGPVVASADVPHEVTRGAIAPSADATPNLVSAREQALQRLAYAQAWERDLPPAMTAFRAWTRRLLAAPPAQRAALVAEGVALAHARQAELLALIQTDPERALAVTVPAVVRQELPPSVIAELEARVAGTGDFGVHVSGAPEAGAPPAEPKLSRVAFFGGVSYAAHAYGRREAQLAKEGASLHGIALGRELALHESPLRVLEPGETPAGAVASTCPVSGLAVAPLATGTGVNLDTLNVVAANGRVYELCGGMNMLDQLETSLAVSEDEASPRVQARAAGAGASATSAPGTAADAATSNTLGAKQVLVLRVDTSDFPGEPLSVAATQSAMDATVKPNLEAYSYGLTTVVSTVSPAVYRLPRTGASYALAADEASLFADAVTAAAANYNAANFDRVVVLHPRLSTVPGSQITYGGEALAVGGTKVVINGGTNIGSVTHELGHCYGLLHANLWQVNDGNPVSSNATTIEYGDPFDMMADATHAFGGARDTRHHFNPWQKNRLGWIADGAVTTVTTSGRYRVYRFDTPTPAANQPLALRIFRDGVRWYWIGYRQAFSGTTANLDGATIHWGFNNPQQSELLDLTTPGVNATDAALAVGATFTDPVYGITIKAVSRGGADPAQYLDLDITVPASPPSVVTAWGRTGAYFFAGNTGLIANPTPETYVPFGLTDVTAIALGDLHALALKKDGSLVVWGDNTNSQIFVPAGLNGNIAAIAAGGNVSGVVRTDGTVQLWGESLGGVTTPPAGLTGVKQLAIGGSHSIGLYHALALKTDGTVVAWGSNSNGQLNVPAGLSGVVAIGASDRLSVALKADGTVVRWGVTFSGAVAFPTGLSGIAAIATNGGAEHALALKTDGTVIAWGANSSNQCNVPAGLTDVVAIATGNFHSLALKSDGSVVAWGSNVNGQTTAPAALLPGYAIAASSRANFLITGAHLYLTAPPSAQNAVAGGTATFSVGATGVGPLTYQWRKDGVPIAGATGSTLTLSAITAASAGSYDVIVRDSASTLTSSAAKLTVTAAPPVATTVPAHLINLSVLAPLVTAGDSFSLGYVVNGATATNAKPLVIRAAGPSLGALGVGGTLIDPKIELYAGSTKTGENDDWGGSSATAAAMAAVGGFPYTGPASRDAAVAANIIARDNSVKISAGAFAPSATGTVIAEVYDATPAASFNATTTPRLINFSVIKSVGSSVTLGFVVGGSVGTTENVLVRAIGPTLGAAPFNVGGAMGDPKVELFDATGKSIAMNDNWGGTTALSAAFGQTGAFSLATGSKDAALVAQLAPGNYSVVVTPVAGTTGGIALLEVYDVP